MFMFMLMLNLFNLFLWFKSYVAFHSSNSIHFKMLIQLCAIIIIIIMIIPFLY